MVEPLQREAMQVGEIARHMKLGHLALTAGQILGARQPAVEQQGTAVQLLPGANDHLIRAVTAGFRHQPADYALLI